MKKQTVRPLRSHKLNDVTNRLSQTTISTSVKNTAPTAPTIVKQHKTKEKVEDYLAKKSKSDEVVPPPPAKKRRPIVKVEPPAKKEAIVIEQSIDDSSNNEVDITPAEKFEKCLRDVLTDAYCDISSRMKIPFKPKCVTYPEHCWEKHFESDVINRAKPIDKVYLDKEKPMFFLHLVNTATMRDQLLDMNTLPLLLEVILCVNDPPIDERSYTVHTVLNRFSVAFLQILSTFPPCWKAANATYERLILKPILDDGFMAKDGFEKSKSLLLHIIEEMERMLSTSSADVSLDDTGTSERHHIPDFFKWEVANTQKYKFSRHKRNVKIDRLFFVMELLIQTMERDLATWTMINLCNPTGKMADSEKIPLIGAFLWAKEHRQVNYTVKRIIKLFIDCVSIRFPSDKLAVLSRFVNLMYSAFDLCDNKMTRKERIFQADRIVYPNSPKYQYSAIEYFREAIYKELKAHQSYGAVLFMGVIDSVTLPSLKHFLITKMINSIDRHEHTLNPESICKILRKKVRDCIDDGDSDLNTDTDGSGDDYPFLDKIQKRCKSSISDRQYVNLMVKGLNAYAEMHHLQEIDEKSGCIPRTPPRIKSVKLEPDEQKPVLVSYSERQMMKHTPELMAKQMANAKNTPMNYRFGANLKHVINIFVDAETEEKFRSDLKFFRLSKKAAQNLNLN